MKKVIVTGAAGFLGINLIAELRRQGIGVIAIDDDSAGTWDRLMIFNGDPGVVTCRANVGDYEALQAVWPKGRLYGIVHLAARHFIPDCEANPRQTWRTNVGGTANVLSVMKQEPPQRFLLASTADVYAASTYPLKETDPIAPTTVYGRSKQSAESLVAEAALEHRESAFLIMRIFNMYGASPTVHHLIPSIVNQLAVGPELRLGNLDTTRDYVYVQDVARAVAELLYTPVTGVLNIGTGIGTEGHKIVHLIGNVVGRRLAVSFDVARKRKNDRPFLVASPERLNSLLSWWPATRIDEGLMLTIASELGLRENQYPIDPLD